MLGPAPEPTPGSLIDDPDGEYACPRCRSTRSKALPPYHLMAMVAAVAASTWLAAIAQWKWVAAMAVLAPLVLHRLEWRAPHWRCLNCSHAWNHNARRRKRADARRDAID